MIELPKDSIVKPYPATQYVRLKLALATCAFFLMTVLLAGSTDELQTALPAQENAVPVYTQASEEEIDYEELLNRIPLRKSAEEPSWQDWFSEQKRHQDFG